MKKIVEFLVAAGVVASLSLHLVQFLMPPAKVGYVDAKALLNQHPLVPQIQKDLNQRRELIEQNFQKLTGELDSLAKVFTGLKIKEDKVRLAQLLDEKRSNALKYQSESMKKLRSIEEENLKPVLESINLHIKEYAKNNNVDLILGAVPDNIVYANQVMDLTPPLGKMVSNISVAAK